MGDAHGKEPYLHHIPKHTKKFPGLNPTNKKFQIQIFLDKSENFEPQIFLDKSKKIGSNFLVLASRPDF